MRSWANAVMLVIVAGLGMQVSAQQTPDAPVPSGERSQAQEALRSKDSAETLARYRAMVAAHPKDDQALTALGVLLYGQHQFAEAADMLGRALAINPAAPNATLFLALSRAAIGQCDRADPSLETSFSSQPNGKLQRLTGLTLLGCLLQSNDASRALPVAAALRKNYPEDADVLYESAELYTRLWSEAADELMTSHPESYRVHQLAAEVNEAQGNLEQAIRQYRAVLAENDRVPQMHYRIGQLLLRLGAPDADQKAMEEFRAELLIDGQSANSALAMGEIDRHLGRLDAATEDYNLVLKIEPDRAEARVGLAQVLLAQHRTADAEAELRPLLVQQPDNAQAHYAMMLAYRAEGKLTEAAAEMALFQQKRQASADQFQQKLNALLTGNQPGHAAAESQASPQ